MAKTKLKTGAQMIVDILIDEGVTMAWGVTGGVGGVTGAVAAVMLVVIVEVASGTQYSVDSWTRAYGQSPEIMTISEWKSKG